MKATGVGESLREFREAAGLSQSDVAAELGISPQAVSKWEAGRSRPDVYRLRKLDELYAAGGRLLAVFDLAPTFTDEMEAMRALLERQNERIAELERRLSGDQ